MDHFHSLLWRSETECTNALYMHNLIVPLMPLYRVKNYVNFGEDQSSSYAENRLTNGNCAATRLQFDDRRPFVMLVFENELVY